MANVLGLALKISADASQLKLTPVERALQTLGAEAAKVTSIFDQFTSGSAAAQRSQQQFATDLAFLNSALKTGQITAQQFAEEFANLAEAAQGEADALREAARITESVRSPLERFIQTAGTLQSQLDAGLITQETYNRALEQAAKGLTDADRAAAGLAERDRAIEQAAQAAADAEAARTAALREGASLTASLLTTEERRQERLTRLDELLSSGAISEETYRRAVEQASGVQEAAARAEQERQRVLAEGERLTAQFATVEERRAAELANLQRLLDAGAISQETFQRASAEASGANEAAARAERERADALAAASRIIRANLTPQERYDAQIVELRGHLEAGRLSQEQFNRAVERASADLNKTATSARSADTQLQSIARQLTTISRLQIGRAIVDGFQVLSGLFRNITGQLQGVISSVSQSIDSINDLSARTDIGVEALQGLGLAAKLSGVDTEQFAVAVTRLGVAIGKADPGGTFDKSLRSLNLTLAELRGLSPEQQFAAIGEQISQLPTAAERAAAAVEIFGKQGAALAPLFKAGAASVDEIVQRAERLGIVLREDQVANVAELNDTFDLVSATIQGIIGQVTGNLAPIVTALANEFLAFVEGFNGIEATGGTALADRITSSLLDGAEVLAGIFDRTVAQFEGFSVTLGEVSQAFEVGTSILQSVVSAAQALFNLGQSIISAITLGVGKVLEQLGRIPFLSDLAETGRALADAAFEQLEKNADEFKNAVDSSIASAGDAIFGETPAEAGDRGAGAAEQYIQQFRSKVEEAQSPVFRVESDIEKTREAFDNFFDGVVDQSSRVTDLMREFEAAVAAAREDSELTADEIARIEELQQGVNTAIQQELAARAEAVAAAQEQQQADEKRIDSLLKTTDATSKITEDLAAVEREIARVQQEIAETGTTGSEDRLNQLQALQGQLEEQLQAAAQGFEQGFDKAFEATGNNFSRLAEQANEFGQAGIDAAARLQEGIAAAQEQARDGILNREAFEAEVARREQLFQQEIEQVKAVADERKRVNDFVDQQFNLARFGGDQQRLEAANRVAEIEREIIRVQGEVQAARANGDQAAVNAGIQRLGLLDQVGAKEANIASGRQQLEQQIAEQRDQYLKQLEEQQKQAQQQQQAFLQQQQKAIEAEQARQTERLRELNTLGAGVIEGSDIRTSEGAALFLQLAAQQQDPALIEARLQTRRLTEIRQAVVGLVEGLTGLPTVRIPGALG